MANSGPGWEGIDLGAEIMAAEASERLEREQVEAARQQQQPDP